MSGTRKMGLLRRTGLVIALVLSVRCSEEFPVEPEDGFIIELGELTLPDTVALGTRVPADIIVTDDQGNRVVGIRLDWSSDDDGVIEVEQDDDSTYLVAAGVGSTQITVSVNDERFQDGEQTVPVTVVVDGVRLHTAVDTARFASLADTVILAASAIGVNGNDAVAGGVEWQAIGTGIVNVRPFAGGDSVRVIATGNGTTVLRAFHSQCRNICEHEVPVRVQQVPVTIVMPDDSTHFDRFAAQHTIERQVNDARGNPIAGAFVRFRPVAPQSVVAVDSVTGVLTSTGNGAASITVFVSPSLQRVYKATVHQSVAAVRASADSVRFNALGLHDTVSARVLDPGGADVTRAVTLSWSLAGAAGVATLAPLTSDSLSADVASAANGLVAIHANAEGRADTIPVRVAQVVGSVLLDLERDLADALSDTVDTQIELRDPNNRVVTGAAVTLSSANTAVASIAGNRVVAVGPGATFIRAISGGAADSVRFVVEQVPASVSAAEDTLEFDRLGATQTTSGTVRDRNGFVIVGWPVRIRQIGSQVVISVDTATGVVTSVGNGVGRIRVIASGAVQDTVTAVVHQAVGSVLASVDSVRFEALGLRDTVSITVRDPGGVELQRNVSVAWSASSGGVTTVSPLNDDSLSAELRSDANGFVRVNAIVEGRADTVRVRVSQATAGVSLQPETDLVDALGDTVDAVVEVRDPAGQLIADATYTLTSSDSSVIRILGGNRLLSVTEGSAVITASSNGVEDAATIIVEQAPSSVTLAEDTIRFDRFGATGTLSAIARDRNGFVVAGVTIGYEVVAGGATVSLDPVTGALLALSNGTATIEAAAGNGAVGLATVITHQAIGSVQASIDSLAYTALGVVDTVSLTVLDPGGVPVERNFVVSWEAFFPEEPIVWITPETDATRAEFVSGWNGSVFVTATIEGVRDSVHVLVLQEPARIEITLPRDTINAIGDTLVAEATVRDANGFEAPAAWVSWESDSVQIAEVDHLARIVARGRGTAHIRAISGSALDTVAVLVRQVAMTGSVSPAQDTVLVDSVFALQLSAADSNGVAIDAPTASWATSDPDVAEVDAAGTVTTTGSGTVQIDADFGGGLVRSAVIKVNETGYAALDITDAPTEAFQEVYLHLAGIGLLDETGPEGVIALTDSITVRLIELTNGIRLRLGAAPVTTGAARTLRVAIDSVTVHLTPRFQFPGGTNQRVLVPAQTSFDVALPAAAAVPDGDTLVVVLDVDAGLSFDFEFDPSEPYTVTALDFAPVTHAIDASTTTLVSGSVTMVGDGAVPYDTWVVMHTADGDSTSAPVAAGGGFFVFPYLNPGNYTLSLVPPTYLRPGIGSVAVPLSAGDSVGNLALSMHYPTLDSVHINQRNAVINAIGYTTVLTATAHETGADTVVGLDDFWFTLDPGVATVDMLTGVVQGQAVGRARIIAMTLAEADTVEVEVRQVAGSVILLPSATQLEDGAAFKPQLFAYDSGGTEIPEPRAVWSSNAPAVASVTASGVVYGVSVGNAIISAAVDGVVDLLALQVRADFFTSHHYELDGNANDATGTLNGVFIGTPTAVADRHGTAGGAMQFGVDDFGEYMRTPETTPLDSTSYGTILFWVKPSEAHAFSTNTIFCYCNHQNSSGWRFYNEANAWGASQLGGAESSGWPLSAGYWHHVAIVSDGFNETRIYIDGEQSLPASGTTPSWPGLMNTHPMGFYLGSLVTGSGDPGFYQAFDSFDGVLDDFRVVLRALSAEEVALLFEAERSPLAEIEMPADFSITRGDTVTLHGIPRSEGGDSLFVDVIWSSSDTTIAKVDTLGFVTTVRQGTVRISASAAGVTGDTEITVEPVGLVAHYPMNTSLADMSGHGYDYMVMCSGTSCNLQGRVDRFGRPDSAQTPFYLAADTWNNAAMGRAFAVPYVTLSAWIQTAQAPGTTFPALLFDSNRPPFGGFALTLVNGGRVQFALRTSSVIDQFSIRTSGALNDNVWHHVVATWDGITASLWVDGTLAARCSGDDCQQSAFYEPGPMRYLNGRGWLGMGSDWTGASLDSHSDYIGGMDDVMLWDVALSDAEVQALYESQHP